MTDDPWTPLAVSRQPSRRPRYRMCRACMITILICAAIGAWWVVVQIAMALQ